MRSTRLTAGLSTLAITALAVSLLSASGASADPTIAADEPVTWEVPMTGTQATELLDIGFDVVDFHDDHALITGDSHDAQKLRDLGFEPEFLDTVYKEVTGDVNTTEDTFYGGYRTASAHMEHAEAVATANPALATTFDIGDSWRKTQGLGGHDIVAICITNQQPGDCELSPNSTKPRFSIISQIHAREIATGELTYRWIDYLVNGYGSDTAVTELLDTTEIWVVPIANPDGVDIVASGGNQPILHRKNANTSYGSCSGTGRGVDLNRNHSFKWGGAGTNPCGETYQGPNPGSEPEVAALEQFFGKIHPDQRGSGDNDPAPADTRDVMISLHSYGNYIIHPWGWTGNQSAPNRTELRALGQAQSQHNGYRVGTASETVGYTATGATDDFTYGEFGIASYTYEVGSTFGSCGGFFPQYSCIDNTFWPANRAALMTAAQVADAPYGGGDDPGEPTECTGANTTSTPLPDTSTTTSTIDVTCDRQAGGNSTVSVNISHTYRGDLRIELVSASGSVRLLKSPSYWDGGNDVVATYQVDLSGLTGAGTWTLRVTDVYAGDTGTLNNWSITV